MKIARIPGVILTVSLCLSAASPRPPGQQHAPRGEAGYRLIDADPTWVAQTMARLSLRDKVAQLVQVRASGRFANRESAQFQELADAVRRNHVGGITLFAGDVFESAVLLNELQKMSDLPLFVAADFERGASFRITDSTSFPWSMAIGATGSEDFAYQEGAITAREARALGVQWVFAPVVDVNNNPDNPVINIRSYGEDPQLVARLAAAFIRGARDNGVLTTAKHFPGHGDTATDSHIGLAVVPSNKARLESVELVPFRSAVAAGVDAIMTAHVAVPQVTGEPDVPATLSPKILTDLLRGELQFQGLVVTDALGMGGITTRYWTGLACIRALQAGADMLLLPQDTDVAINEVVRAVERGDISVARIDESVAKILTFKTRLGLHQERTVPLDSIEDVVAAPESQRLAQQMADASITLLKDDAHALPINPLNPPKIFSLVLSSDADANPGSVFQSELRRRFPAAHTEAADPRIPQDLAASITRSAAEADVIVCATVVRLISGSGSIALPESERVIIRKLLAVHKPVIWIAFGNPYLLRLFPQAPTYLCTFSYADVSQIAAAKALAGEIAITGRTPVSIPARFKVGDGLRVPKLEMTLRPQTESKGLAPDAFDATKRLLNSYVSEHAFPGAALAVGYRGTLVLDAAVGKLDYTPSSAAVTGDTVYDLASLSKVVGTTSAVMMLADSGALLLDAPVQDYLPEFQGTNKEKVRVIHLLQHSSGMPAWLPIYKEVQGYEEFMKRVYAVPLEFAPGSRTQYSDLGMILLGEIVARACGHPLDQYISDRLFAPLGMKSTLYRPPKDWLEHIAPTEDDPWRQRVVRGEVHDENAYAMGGVAGHAGLFSTAHDLAVFAQMMLNRGMYDHRRYFRSETVERFTLAQGLKGGTEALGWQKPEPRTWTAKAFSAAAFGHTGFTGTSIWIDPQRQLFIVLLTNSIHPSRENTKITEVRQKLAESVLRALHLTS
jgi:beta-glucosidase-like glycosyl hydrolase/CubicO group peptidase (beta-lactamase class C family)